MTTVAYRDGVLASDTQVTSGNSNRGDIEKIRKVDGWLIGFAGECRLGAEWLDWLDGVISAKNELCRTPKELQYGDENDSISGVAVSPKGEVWVWDGVAYPYKVRGPFYAVGSGSDYAIGAMAMGASAEEAVRVAMRFDCYTGGKVKVLKHG